MFKQNLQKFNAKRAVTVGLLTGALLGFGQKDVLYPISLYIGDSSGFIVPIAAFLLVLLIDSLIARKVFHWVYYLLLIFFSVVSYIPAIIIIIIYSMRNFSPF